MINSMFDSKFIFPKIQANPELLEQRRPYMSEYIKAKRTRDRQNYSDKSDNGNRIPD